MNAPTRPAIPGQVPSNNPNGSLAVAGQLLLDAGAAIGLQVLVPSQLQTLPLDASPPSPLPLLTTPSPPSTPPTYHPDTHGVLPARQAWVLLGCQEHAATINASLLSLSSASFVYIKSLAGGSQEAPIRLYVQDLTVDQLSTISHLSWAAVTRNAYIAGSLSSPASLTLQAPSPQP